VQQLQLDGWMMATEQAVFFIDWLAAKKPTGPAVGRSGLKSMGGFARRIGQVAGRQCLITAENKYELPSGCLLSRGQKRERGRRQQTAIKGLHTANGP
jgi:hypothetical protein